MPVVELHEVGIPARPVETSARPRSNLPQPPEGFLGRGELLAELPGRIATGGLTILKGEWGMGKTTLALRADHDELEAGELPGGVAWFDCLTSPGLDEFLRQMGQVFFGDRMERDPIEQCQMLVSEHL
jgi:hypothetical protein